MDKKEVSTHIKYASIALSGVMILALFQMPYAYYEFLRLFVLIAGGFIIYSLHKINSFESVLIFLVIGSVILWNPVFPFYMERST